MTLRRSGRNLLISLTIGLAVAAVAVHLRAGMREAAAEENYPPSGQILNIDGIPVHAVVQGEGPDLVLIHGASGNLRDFTFDLVGRLAQDYRVIALDRPGLGYTRGAHRAQSITEQAALLQQAAAELGAETPIVVGQSYGGAVALAWAVTRPDNIAALVPLAAASNPWEGGLSTFYKVTSHPLGKALVVPVITAVVGESRIRATLEEVFAPNPVPEGYAAHIGAPLTLRRETLRANAEQRAALKPQIIDLHKHYGEIAVPTEIVHGADDTTVGLAIHSEPLSRQIPGAVLTTLPGIGHMPHHSATDAVVEAIHRAAGRAGLR